MYDKDKTFELGLSVQRLKIDRAGDSDELSRQAHNAGANKDASKIGNEKMKKIREMYEEDYNLKIKKEMEEDENESIKILKEMEEMIVDGFNEGMDELYDEEVDELERLKVENKILKFIKKVSK